MSEQIKATDATITDDQADDLAAFLASEGDLWSTTAMPICRTGDDERFAQREDGTYPKLNTKVASA